MASIQKNSTPAPSQDELYALFCDGHQRIEDLAGECVAFRDLLSPSIAAFFKYVFGRIDQEKAKTFFEQLLYGAGPNTTLPVHHLRRRLEADRARKAKLPRTEKLALIIKAWNLHVADGQCRSLWWRFEFGRPEMEPLQVHPVAAIFPEMSGAPFAELMADIQQNGLREPVMLHPDGSIIDGRNRYRACRELGIEPTFRTWDGQGSLVSLILSLNLHRRQLTESQRAMVGARVVPLFVDDAKQRMGVRTDLCTNLDRGDLGRSSEKAATVVNVSRQSVMTAAKVIKSGVGELVQAIDRGEVSVSSAARLAELPADKQHALLAAEGPKRACSKAAEIKQSRRRHRRSGSQGQNHKRLHPERVPDPSDEELLSGRLFELIAHYELISDRRVAGIEIERSEAGPVASIRILHEPGRVEACSPTESH